MRWQRIARRVVAVIGLGTAVAIYALSRERPVAERPGPSAERDPAATVAAGHGVQVRYRGSSKQFTLEYGAIRQYADGRQSWDDVRLSLEDGTTVSAKAGESRGQPGANGLPQSISLKDDVRVHTADGTDLQAATATYEPSSGVARMPGLVRFTRGPTTGSGTGATYERDSGTFHLLAGASVTTAPADGGSAIKASGDTMTFTRADRTLVFDDQVRIVRATDVMTADRASLQLSEDDTRFDLIELRGHSRVTPDPGAGAGTPDMRATDIDLTFHDGTQVLERALLRNQSRIVMAEGGGRRSIDAGDITVTMAGDGQTVTHLEASPQAVVRLPAGNGVPARIIRAASLAASGDDAHGLTSAVFTGGASFVETVPASAGRSAGQRSGTSRRLTMSLKGQLDAIDEAHFEHDVVFKDGGVTGTGALGIYRATQGALTLEPAGGSPADVAHVDDGRVTVDAAESIEVDLDTENLHARREVKTVTAGEADGESGRPDTALFSDREPVYGFGAEFWYDHDAGKARYQGGTAGAARLQQGDVRVAAAVVTVLETTNDVTAEGQVDATLALAGPGAGGATAPVRYRFEADALQ